MRQISGIVNEPLTIDGEVALTGIANKTITVSRGARLLLSGVANDDIIVEPGGELELSGIVNGTVHRRTTSGENRSSI